MSKPISNLTQLICEKKLLPLSEYDKIICSYSGGKDSLAQVLQMVEHPDVHPEQLELWHQNVDGEPGTRGLMDWPCTEGYVRATSKALKIPLKFQWKDKGFEGEMLRENCKTQGIYFEDGDGNTQYVPPTSRGKLSTRRKFPQISADLQVRWCSSYLKIDVARRAINNDSRFKTAKILFLTGERREESTARAKYREVEKHTSNNKKRRVNQWRSIIDWKETDVWEIIERHRIKPHPAYYLGWGRVSCMACIFGDRNQWASVFDLAKDRFERIAQYEEEFGVTIKRGESVREQANRGISFVKDAPDWLIKLAMSADYPPEEFFLSLDEKWHIPSGAYKRCGGPT